MKFYKMMADLLFWSFIWKLVMGYGEDKSQPFTSSRNEIFIRPEKIPNKRMGGDYICLQ